MTAFAPHIVFILTIAIFLSVVFLHLTKKNTSAILLYILQSCAVAALLSLSLIEHFSFISVVAILATITVKIVLAPTFLWQLIRTHQLRFSSSTYLNNPLTLLVLALFVALTFSRLFAPLGNLSPENPTLVLLVVASLLSSLFLLINRKGAISQMLGVLSIENSIVAFALFTGLEQGPALQLGITFNILLWVSVATIFISMLYRQFGSLDVTLMKNLSENNL